MDGFRTLRPGDRVSYEVLEGPKGKLAQQIRPVHQPVQLQAA